MTSARNRELLALVPASLLLTAGFAAVFIERNDVVTNVSLTYGAIFLGLCLAAHLVLRLTLPYADPYLFPLVAVLACFGLVMIYRIDDKLAREQAQWFVIGLGLFAATIILLRDYRVLERYRYTIAAVGIVLLLLPRLPGIGSQVNGAYLGVRLGPLTFQPAEFAKIAIIVFLASYLRDTRQLLVIGARRFARRHHPAAQALRAAARRLGRGDGHALLHPRPRLVADVLRRLPGDALRGHQPLLVRGRRPVAVRRGVVGPLPRPPDHHADRVDAWQHPFGRRSTTCRAAATRSRSRSSRRPTAGLFGRGFGAGRCSTRRAARRCCPRAQTDLIYAVIVNELGLVGACAAAAASTCWSSSAASRSRCWRATRSPSCWPPA